MPIYNRTFTYRGFIRLNKEDLALARSGRKTCTIRLGKLGVAGEIVFLISGSDKIKVRIINIDNNRLYADLTDQDAQMDGLDSKQQLDEDLRRFYGSIDPKQPMTIIQFQLLED